MPFAINKTSTHLELKGGYLKIQPYGYQFIPHSDVTHPHLEEAVHKGWLEISATEPVVSHAPVFAAESESSPFEGLTEAELLAGKAAESKPAEAIEAEENKAKDAEESNVDTAVTTENGSVEVTEIATPKTRKSAKTEKADKAEAAPKAE